MKSGVSLLFAAGERPSADTIDRILASSDGALPGAVISHRAPEGEGWIELLASGLTFELHGLPPAEPLHVTSPAHRFGLGAAAVTPATLEAVALITGPHISGGKAMIPIVRTMTGLAANLALLLPVRAVCWEPAESWMEPRYFARAIIAWLSGGPFPALGLTAVVPGPEGFVSSSGLSFFSGQEIRVAAFAGEPPAETAKLAIRVIDDLIRRGPIEQRTELDAPSGEVVIAEPSRDGRMVTVWRGR